MKRGFLQDSRPREYTLLQNTWGENIPVIRNWASSEQRFVVAQVNVARCYWRFGSVSAPGKDSATAWYSPESQEQQRVFTIPNCTIDENYSWTPPTKEPDAAVLSMATPHTATMTLLLVLFLSLLT